MTKTIFVSEIEKSAYLDEVQDKFDNYISQIFLIKNFYEERKFRLPIPAYANFRDALFHFSKMNAQGDYIKLVQQDYALEEHLHRSLKDSIITLFYKLTEGLESLLNINKMINDGYDIVLDEKENELLKLVSSADYIGEVFEKYAAQYSKETIYKVLLKQYINNIHLSIDKTLREVLHKIKNNTLSIRNVSLNIERPLEEDSQINYYLLLFSECEMILSKLGILEYVYYAEKLNKIFFLNVIENMRI